jgi:glycine C-acetyltransferase
VLAAAHGPIDQHAARAGRHARELEDAVSMFLGRESTLLFPSAHAASVGALTALLGAGDFVAHDSFAHPRLIDGCRRSGATSSVYEPGDPAAMEGALARGAATRIGMVVTDGLSEAQASIADLPALRGLCDRARARLVVDDTHGLGVLGHSGRGVEEHWGMPGRVDVLLGGFEAATGATGGYVSGSRALVDFLRNFARAETLTAATCAGLTAAFGIMDREPEHRLRLWANARRLWSGLRETGWIVPEGPAPLVTVFVGHERLLRRARRELFACGFTVAADQAALRMCVTSRHLDDDLDRAVEVLALIGERYGILDRDPEEIVARGAALPPDADAGP